MGIGGIWSGRGRFIGERKAFKIYPAKAPRKDKRK